MAVGKVVAHLCLKLIIKELKSSVEHGRVVTTLDTTRYWIIGPHWLGWLGAGAGWTPWCGHAMSEFTSMAHPILLFNSLNGAYGNKKFHNILKLVVVVHFSDLSQIWAEHRSLMSINRPPTLTGVGYKLNVLDVACGLTQPTPLTFIRGCKNRRILS